MPPQHKKQKTSTTSKQLHEAARKKWLSLSSLADLVVVEKLLRESVAIAKEEERQSLDALCLLLCQQARNKEAVAIMQKLGHVARLSKQVLHYPLPTTTATAATAAAAATSPYDPACTPLRVFDNALPASTLQSLQATFCAGDAHYWTSHNYAVYPPSPYFSFVVPITPTSFVDYGPLGELLRTIVTQTEAHFGGASEAKYAEIWAHRRPHSSGHQLHFDSDDEGRGGVRNPLVSTVLYLSDEGCGGPTLVTDQHIDGDALAQQGWLAFPKENRLVIFDGAVLHGVIPGRGYVNNARTRTTLMVALWDEIQVREGEGPGAARRLPGSSGGEEQSLPEWCVQLTSMAGGTETTAAAAAAAATATAATAAGTKEQGVIVNPVHVDSVWTDLEDNNIGNEKPGYDVCFQGF